jgi:hypothetical protein
LRSHESVFRKKTKKPIADVFCALSWVDNAQLLRQSLMVFIVYQVELPSR